MQIVHTRTFLKDKPASFVNVMAKKGQNELKHFHILLSLEEFQNINNQSISRKERYKHLLTVFPEFYETLLGKKKTQKSPLFYPQRTREVTKILAR